MNLRNLIHWYINPLVIGGAIFLTLLLTIIALSILWFSRPAHTRGGHATAVLNVIRLPTATYTPSPLPEFDSTRTPLAPQPGNGEIIIGGYIQIAGTGGDGLRLRNEPGLDGQIQFVAAENEVFLAKDGPRELDGYVWWFLIGAEYETIRGWAVADYMEAIQYP